MEGREQPVGKRQEPRPHDDHKFSHETLQDTELGARTIPNVSVQTVPSSTETESGRSRCINIPIQVESGHGSLSSSARVNQFGNHSDSNLDQNYRVKSSTPGQKSTSGIRPQSASYGNLSSQRPTQPSTFGQNQAQKGHYYPESFQSNGYAPNHSSESQAPPPAPQQTIEQPAAPPQQSTKSANPIDQIDEIVKQVHTWSSEIDDFKGTAGDKQYRYLDEYLTRSLLKLDQIETNGIQEIRQARKNAIVLIESIINKLENVAKSNNEETPMEVSSELTDDQMSSESNTNTTTEKALQATLNLKADQEPEPAADLVAEPSASLPQQPNETSGDQSEANS